MNNYFNALNAPIASHASFGQSILSQVPAEPVPASEFTIVDKPEYFYVGLDSVPHFSPAAQKQISAHPNIYRWNSYHWNINTKDQGESFYSSLFTSLIREQGKIHKAINILVLGQAIDFNDFPSVVSYNDPCLRMSTLFDLENKIASRFYGYDSFQISPEGYGEEHTVGIIWDFVESLEKQLSWIQKNAKILKNFYYDALILNKVSTIDYGLRRAINRPPQNFFNKKTNRLANILLFLQVLKDNAKRLPFNTPLFPELSEEWQLKEINELSSSEFSFRIYRQLENAISQFKLRTDYHTKERLGNPFGYLVNLKETEMKQFEQLLVATVPHHEKREAERNKLVFKNPGSIMAPITDAQKEMLGVLAEGQKAAEELITSDRLDYSRSGSTALGGHSEFVQNATKSMPVAAKTVKKTPAKKRVRTPVQKATPVAKEASVKEWDKAVKDLQGHLKSADKKTLNDLKEPLKGFQQTTKEIKSLEALVMKAKTKAEKNLLVARIEALQLKLQAPAAKPRTRRTVKKAS